MGDFLAQLRLVDAFPKTLEDFRVRTTSGAAISAVAVLLMTWLFAAELSYYLTPEVRPALSVDTSRAEDLRINVDVTFHSIPCHYLGIDAMDMTGQHQFNVEHTLFKKRLGRDGMPLADTPQRQRSLNSKEQPHLQAGADTAQKAKDPAYCGSCYGAEQQPGQCCNTCDDVQDAYQKKGWSFSNADGIEQCANEGWKEKMAAMVGEGCQVYGYMLVNKVQGNFHFAPGRSFQQHHMHVHDLQPLKDFKFTMAHTINRLSFGRDYPGLVNPLDGAAKRGEDEAENPGMHQYFVKVVPTEYRGASGEVIDTNQFSVTEHFKKLHDETARGPGGHAGGEEHGLPGVFIMYDISPIKVTYSVESRSFAHFLTGVCAIVGGIFTVAGLVDSVVYHGARQLRKRN